MSNNIALNYIQPADTSGCAAYRMWFPYWHMRQITRETAFVESPKAIADQTFFRGFRHAMIQRAVHDGAHAYFMQFLKPLSERLGFWLTYNVDDCMGHIPKYNNAHDKYCEPKIQQNIKEMLQAADFMIVTTPYIKDYYANHYGVPAENIIDIPNYMPRWWVGETYNIDRITADYRANVKKPKIGIISSLSHFDLTGSNNYVDDFTHVNEFIRSTVDRYEWCFYMRVPKQLEDLAKSGKITIYPASDVMNYVRELYEKRFQLIIAPLQDNVFNRCKSNIKLIECWSLGIPVIAQNLPLYSKYTDSVFTDANDLQNKIDETLKSENYYRKTVQSNRKVVDYGDENSPDGWWLEKNMAKWFKLFTMPNKKMSVSRSQLAEFMEKTKKSGSNEYNIRFEA